MSDTLRRSAECAYDYAYALARHVHAVELVDGKVPAPVVSQLDNLPDLARQWWPHAAPHVLTEAVDCGRLMVPPPWSDDLF